MEPIPKDLIAASATPIVLAILRRGDDYGYAIIRTVRETSGERLAWTDGMLYPVLHRLEAGGLVESYRRVAANGRARKYYRITELGETEFQRMREQWYVVHNALESLSRREGQGVDGV